MKTKILLILHLIFLLGVVGIQSYLLSPTQLKTSKSANTISYKLLDWRFPVVKLPSAGSNKAIIAYSDIRDPGGIPQGLPVRLKIPIIGVDSMIEDALITPDGRMDVPAGTINVAWFALGPHPGQVGSAVIGGHYGKYEANKGPTVFYYLDKLKVGDKVYIEDDSGNTLAFVVRAISLFDRNADATTVFTSQDGLAHLNIITCEGVWNRVDDSYPDRRVVFTDAIPSEGPVMATKPKIATKVILTPTQIPTILPNSVKSPASSALSLRGLTPSQILIKSAISSYATPLDGLITSLLLIPIFLLALKVARR